MTDYQKELLSKDEKYTLEEDISRGRTYEASASHLNELYQMNTPQAVHAVRRKDFPKCRNCGGSHSFKAKEMCPVYGTFDVTGPAVVGLPSCEKLKLVILHCSVNQSPVKKPTIINNVNDLKEQYPNQFDRIGKFRGEYEIVVDPDVQPHIDAPRKTPIALKRFNKGRA